MNEKPIDWRGSSLKDFKSDDIFTQMPVERLGGS